MAHWQLTADLTSIRDKAALAKLPTEERVAFTKFWTEVAAVLTKLDQQGYGVFSVTGQKKAKRRTAKKS